MPETFTAQNVIDKINIFKEPDWVLSEEENLFIVDMYSKVSTKEWKDEVKAYLDSLHIKSVKAAISDAKDDVEKQSTKYWIDALAEKSESKFFNIILKSKVWTKGFKFIVNEKISEHKAARTFL